MGRLKYWRPWSLPLELYVLLLLAGVLRLYHIHTTEFDNDQATLFGLAYDALHQGLLPVTSNMASIGTQHPPGTIYLLMIPALLSPDPLWGAVLVALLSLLAVLLTYLFMRRYYGRAAALIAALLYATAPLPLKYARFIWQPSMEAPFVLLFLCMLFRGAVERRHGWLWPAVLLLAILYQAHEVTLLLLLPLLLTALLAHETIRWRDLLISALCLLLVFFPVLLWLLVSNFRDLALFFAASGQRHGWSGDALKFYRLFLQPYDVPPTRPGALMTAIRPLVSWLRVATPALTLAALLLALVRLALQRVPRSPQGRGVQSPSPLLSRVRAAWLALRRDGQRCGLLILLTWQLFPLLVLSRYGSELHAQYLLMLMPGPFMLVALLLTYGIALVWRRRGAWRLLAPAGYLLAALLVAAQGLAAFASISDISAGYFNDRSFQPYHNDLASLQRALDAADQLAQRHHLTRVYITMDDATRTALLFLSRSRQTPTTLFDAQQCLLLPAVPAVMLVGPYDSLVEALLPHFANVRLITELPRPGGLPFKLYQVAPVPAQGPVRPSLTFTGELQARTEQAETFSLTMTSWLVTGWTLLHTAPEQVNTTYSYSFSVALTSPRTDLQSLCVFSALHAGDMLLSAFALPAGGVLPARLSLRAWASRSVRYDPVYGPLHLETSVFQDLNRHLLRTAAGLQSMVLDVSLGTTSPPPKGAR